MSKYAGIVFEDGIFFQVFYLILFKYSLKVMRDKQTYIQDNLFKNNFLILNKRENNLPTFKGDE